MIVALDPNGFRPLSIGKIGDAYVVASETCAFDVVGATFIRDVEPGELIIINDEGITSDRFTNEQTVQFAAWNIFTLHVQILILLVLIFIRHVKTWGNNLAAEAPIEADVVTGVPDSSISAAIGYAEATGIPYELGLIKNRYVGRTFIQPSQELREQGVKMKLSQSVA